MSWKVSEVLRDKQWYDFVKGPPWHLSGKSIGKGVKERIEENGGVFTASRWEMLVLCTRMTNTWSSEKWSEIGYILEEVLKYFAKRKEEDWDREDESRWLKGLSISKENIYKDTMVS